MQSKKIKHILKKYKRIFEALENYDKTRELPFQRKRLDLTLSVRTLNRLRELKQKTGKSISKLIEDKFGNC